MGKKAQDMQASCLMGLNFESRAKTSDSQAKPEKKQPRRGRALGYFAARRACETTWQLW